MTSTVPFDTLAFLKELESSGMTHKNAEIITEATTKAVAQAIQSHDFATRANLIELRSELQYFIVQTVVGSITVLGAYVTLLKYLG